MERLAEFDYTLKQRAPAIALGQLGKIYTETPKDTTTGPILTKLHRKVVAENAVLSGPYESLAYGSSVLAFGDAKVKEQKAKLLANSRNSGVLALFAAKTQVRKKETSFYRSLEVLSGLFSTVLESLRCNTVDNGRTRVQQLRADGDYTKMEMLARFAHQLFFDRLFVDTQRANSVAFLLDASGRSWGSLLPKETNALRSVVTLPALTDAAQGVGQCRESQAGPDDAHGAILHPEDAMQDGPQNQIVFKNLKVHRALLGLLGKQTEQFSQCVAPMAADLFWKNPNLAFFAEDIATHNYGMCLRSHLHRRIALKKRKIEGASSTDDVVAVQLLDKILEFFKKVRLVPKPVQQPGEVDVRQKFSSQLVSQLKQAEKIWFSSNCVFPRNLENMLAADDPLRKGEKPDAEMGDPERQGLDADIKTVQDPDYMSEFSAVHLTVSRYFSDMMKKIDAASSRGPSGRSASSDELALELHQRADLEASNKEIGTKLQVVSFLEKQQTAYWTGLKVVTPKILDPSGAQRGQQHQAEIAEKQRKMSSDFVDILTTVFQKKVTDTLKNACGMKPDFLERMKTLRVRFAQWLPAALNIQKKLMAKDNVITNTAADLLQTMRAVDVDMVHKDSSGPPVVLDEVLDIFVVKVLNAAIPGSDKVQTYAHHDHMVKCGKINCAGFAWKTTYRERLAVRIWQEAERFQGQEDKVDAMLAFTDKVMEPTKAAMGALLGKPKAQPQSTSRWGFGRGKSRRFTF